MSRGLNKVHLIGNVGADPEVRTSQSGTKIARVSLATNRSYKDRAGEKREEVEWHRITAFGNLADIIEKWVTKGDRLYFEGRLHYSTSEEDGVTRYWTEVIANEMVMLGGAGERAAGPSGTGASSSGGSGGGLGGGSGGDEATIAEPDDDLPF